MGHEKSFGRLLTKQVIGNKVQKCSSKRLEYLTRGRSCMRQRIGWKAITLLCLLLGVASLGGAMPVLGQTGQLNVLAYGEALAPGPAPLLIQGRVYVAAEPLAKTLGWNLDFDQANSTLYLNSYRAETPAKPMPFHGYTTVNLVANGQLLPSENPAILLNQVTYLPLRIAETFGLAVGWNPISRTAYIGSVSKNQLPKVGSLANLQKMLGSSYSPYRYYLDVGMGAAEDTMGKAVEAPTAPPSGAAASDYSNTNVQVQGVDEADIVKTDGQYIYQAKGQTVLISHAYPADQLQLVSTIKFDDQSFSPNELFIDGDRMLVIGQSNNNLYQPMLDAPAVVGSGALTKPAIGMMPPVYYQPTTTLLVYDIKDRAQPKVVRTVELGGSYLTARKVDSRVVLLANQPIYGDPVAPCYQDTAAGEGKRTLPIADVGYFPERQNNSYLLTATFDLQQDDAPAKLTAYLGAGDNIFMSTNNLYVATGRWWGNETNIYKLHLDGTDLSFQAKGSVPGHVLNQFSMDEWNGSLRVATTYDQDGKTNNGVYVLNQSLATTGKLDGIAPGERIYSARFQGERGYLVTFEQVDPLFVLDLSDASNPQILGALKIPGFSTYLQPLDDQHLLGIGRDTMLVEDKDGKGNVVNTRVLEKGMKLAIFNIKDLANPKEEFSAKLGGRGSYSEALYNHKAVLYDATHHLLALPVQLTEASADGMSYGPVVFQGAVVYRVSLEQGFQELGRITHLTAAEQEKAGYYGYPGGSEIRRILYIGDDLYAVSDGQITAHAIDTLELLKSITLP